jgi:hypothetical protein
MPTNTPKAREILKEVVRMLETSDREVDQIVVSKVNEALSMMTRVITKVPARVTARRIDRGVVLETLRALKKYPGKGDRWIGRLINIDGGRVSEIRRGLRTPDHPSMIRDGFSEDIRKAMTGEDDAL